MLENKSDVEKNASKQKCCGKVPVQNMGGVILDIDGTVLDSMSIWQDAGVRYLASQQIEAEPGLAEKIYYMSIPEAALYMRTRYGLEQSVEEISQGIKDVVRDFYYYEAPLKAGVKEFLQKMSDRKIPVVAATASDEDHLEHAFTRLGIRQYFEYIFTCAQAGAGKQSPAVYHMAAGYLDRNPEELYVFEDALYAIRTAKLAGYHTIGVYDEESKEDQEMIREEADIYMESFKEADIFFKYLLLRDWPAVIKSLDVVRPHAAYPVTLFLGLHTFLTYPDTHLMAKRRHQLYKSGIEIIFLNAFYKHTVYLH